MNEELEIEEVLEESEQSEIVSDQASIENSSENPTINFSLQSKVSALLFASSRPLSARKISEVLEREASSIEKALDSLLELYDNQIHGFSLEHVAGKWQFRTAPGLSPFLRRLVPIKDKRLSRAALETLSVIAYRQPVHRPEIESVRGVDALPTLKTLVDAKLVRIIGKEDSLGNPALYGTTEKFLEKFGLPDLSSLPSIAELQKISEDPGEVDDEETTKDGQFEEEQVEEGQLEEDLQEELQTESIAVNES